MKQYTMFECELCGKTSQNANEIIECECKHLGLTIEEMKKWEHLKLIVNHCSCVVSITKNEEIKRSYDEAIEALIQFEKKHNIVQTTKP